LNYKEISMTELLSDIAIQRELGQLPGWSRRGEVLTRTYQFRNFMEAMSFVNRVAEAAEAVDHHPDIDIRYSKVTLTLSTHSAGGITSNDLSLAKAIDASGEDSVSSDDGEGDLA
jgi:4a-hydroxytetrahydrobiopterin dehydratase